MGGYNHSKANRIKRHLSLPVVAVLLLVTAATLYVVFHRHVNEAFRLGTTRQPERFTELYFTDYAGLPKSRLEASKTYTFNFTVVNQESETKDYTYRVSQSDTTRGSKVTSTNKFTLTSGEPRVIQGQFIVYDPALPTTVTVTLLNMNQTIEFRTTP